MSAPSSHSSGSTAGPRWRSPKLSLRSRRAIASTLTYGALTWFFGGNHRLAILATGAYFVIGLLLLFKIDVERGRKAALAEA